MLIALGIYILIAQFAAPAGRHTSKPINSSKSPDPSLKTDMSTQRLDPVDVLLVGLKQRLATQKDDVEGWILLSKSYYHLNRLKEADDAFDKARALGYSGNWMPLPRIDSFTEIKSSPQNLKSMINFRAHKIDESNSQ